MDNDCGCTKKIVDKIYIENSCCGKKEKKTNCNNSCCTSCGKQIDLIDSDLYAENIYNYTENTKFNIDLQILLEGDMISSLDNIADRDLVYNILKDTTIKTEVLVLLKKSLNGIYGLKCIASIKEEDGKYTVVYIKQFKDETILESIPNKTVPLKTILCIYTNNYETATYETIDITNYTCNEIISILELYATKEWVNNVITTALINYYTKDEIDYIISHLTFGEDCLFENGIQNPLNNEFSTQRKQDSSLATGNRSFAISGGNATGDYSIALLRNSVASGENSIAINGGKANGKNTLCGIESALTSNTLSYIDLGSESCVSLIGGNITNSKNSIAISEGRVTSSNNSLALFKGNVGSPGSIAIGLGSTANVNNGSDQFLKTNIENDADSESNIAINNGNSSGRYSIAIGQGEKSSATNQGSISIGMSTYSGGFYSTALGILCEVGRYREENTLEYVYGSTKEERGMGSIEYGRYLSVFGSDNAVFGENHFIKGHHSLSVGNGNNSSGNVSDANLLYGTRSRVERSQHGLVGGLFSQITSTGDKVSIGSISIGDTLPIENLYLKYSPETTGNTTTHYYVLLHYSNNTYTNVLSTSNLGKAILNSTMILRNGKKKYLGIINFNNYVSSNTPRIYPSINQLDEGYLNSGIRFTLLDVTTLDNILTPVTTNTYKCSMKFSHYSNIVDNSSSVSIGTGNLISVPQSAAIGIGNRLTSNSSVTIGKFNNPICSDNKDILFSIGVGDYDKSNYTINRKNILEVVNDLLSGSKDIYFILDNYRYSLREIIAKVHPTAHELSLSYIDDSKTLLTTDTGQENIHTLPGYTSGYARITDTTVFDPNGVIEQSTTKEDI